MLFSINLDLPARLRAVAALVPAGSTVADIGSDHAYLPLYLVASGHCPRVIAIEAAPGPYHRALAAVNSASLVAAGGTRLGTAKRPDATTPEGTGLATARNAGLTGRIEVRRGDGLQPLQPGEVEVVTIAGLGAMTQQEVLAARPEVRRQLRRLVLQPQGKAGPLRRYLAAAGWRLLDEDLVFEGGHYYFIMAAGPGASPAYSDIEWQLGPLLLQKRHPLLADYILDKMAKLTTAVNQLSHSQGAAARKRQEELSRQLIRLREVIAWLQNAVRS